MSHGVRRLPLVNGTWFGYGGTRRVSFCHQYRTPPIGGSKWNASGPHVAASPRISSRIVQTISFWYRIGSSHQPAMLSNSSPLVNAPAKINPNRA